MTIKEKIQMLTTKTRYDFDDLVVLVELLRSEEGCPWDREQDHHSIRKDLIEDTYEVIEAIDNNDPDLLAEELGDLLLQIVLHARIEQEEGRANFERVAQGVCRKMIHRHPHVFGEGKADTVAQVLTNWEKIKSEEKARSTVTDQLRAVPRQLPALMRAAKVGKKATGMDFPSTDSALAKVREELIEVEGALASGTSSDIREEIGDLLLSVTSLCRKVGVDAEEALTRATDKFIDRFHKVETEVIAQNKQISDCSLGELDAIWDKIKKK